MVKYHSNSSVCICVCMCVCVCLRHLNFWGAEGQVLNKCVIESGPECGPLCSPQGMEIYIYTLLLLKQTNFFSVFIIFSH